MGEENTMKNVTECKSNGKTEKPMRGTGIRGHGKVKVPQLEGKDSGSEVTEENHKRGKD